MTAPVNGAFAAALVDELAAVIAALVDTTAASTAAGIGTGPQWVATIEAEGLPDGCSLAFDDAGATALAAQMLGTPDAATREAVLDTLREILAKAVSGIAMKPIAPRLATSATPLSQPSERPRSGRGSSQIRQRENGSSGRMPAWVQASPARCVRIPAANAIVQMLAARSESVAQVPSSTSPVASA